MRIALIASEAVPFSKTGGLADVAGTLYKEFGQLGHEAFLFTPLYKSVSDRFGSDLEYTGVSGNIKISDRTRAFRLYRGKKAGSHTKKSATYFIACDDYFLRDELYGSSAGDYPDNAERFAFFSRAVLESVKALQLKPDVIHCNDWQTGLIPLYMDTLYWRDPAFEKTRTVLTIHNMGYQGIFPFSSLALTGLGPDLFTPEGIEFYGNINYLKAGLISADVLTTVSPTYAQEILTPEHGFGLDGVLRSRAALLHGILNGIDCDEWNPATDRLLPAAYDATDPSGKKACKKELMKRCGFRGSITAPILCFIGRLSSQKGIDLLCSAAQDMLDAGLSIFVLGRGDAVYEQMLRDMAKSSPGAFFFTDSFNNELAHLAYAGADIFLMPSAYEPCGLGQMIAMRYGTLPVAFNTGGLTDSIVTAGHIFLPHTKTRTSPKTDATGFLFMEHTAASFIAATGTALAAYGNKALWKQLIINAMSADFSWSVSAKKYIELYKGSTDK